MPWQWWLGESLTLLGSLTRLGRRTTTDFAHFHILRWPLICTSGGHFHTTRSHFHVVYFLGTFIPPRDTVSPSYYEGLITSNKLCCAFLTHKKGSDWIPITNININMFCSIHLVFSTVFKSPPFADKFFLVWSLSMFNFHLWWLFSVPMIWRFWCKPSETDFILVCCDAWCRFWFYFWTGLRNHSSADQGHTFIKMEWLINSSFSRRMSSLSASPQSLHLPSRMWKRSKFWIFTIVLAFLG